MVNVLLNHVETEKGDTGLYLKDRIAAYEAAAKIVTESFPNQPMTTQQVKSKIYYMIRGSRHVSKEVFRNGRCLLDPSDNDASESDTEDHTSRMSPQNMDTSMDELNEEVPAESPRATLEPGPRSQDLSLSLHSGQRQAPQDAEAALPTGNLQ